MTRLCQLDVRPANCAEWLLDLGRAVRKRLRQATSLDDASCRFSVPPDCCRLALAFVQADDALKFRAMVEDWLPDRIARAIGFSIARGGHTEQRPGTQARAA